MKRWWEEEHKGVCLEEMFDQVLIYFMPESEMVSLCVVPSFIAFYS